MVERMISLNKQKSSESNPETVKLIETQIRVTDKQIDQLVYNLYDLNSDEISLIDGIV